jgi:hypothetical protein
MKAHLAKILLFTFLLLSFFSCQKFDKCEGIICFTPPRGFYIEIVDSNLGENLYTTDHLQVTDITFKNENNENVEFKFIGEEEENLIDISKIGWETGVHTYYLQLSNDIEIVIDIEMQEKNEDCCTFFEVEKFEIRDYDYKISQYSEIIEVEI